MKTFDEWFAQYAPTAPERLDDCAADAWAAAMAAAAEAAAKRQEWIAIDFAPQDRRILVKAESGEIYAAHWVQNPMTDDEAFCVSESADGTQHLVRPVEWREIQ